MNKTAAILLFITSLLTARSVEITIPSEAVKSMPGDFAVGICPENREIRAEGYHRMKRNRDGSFSTKIPDSFGKIAFYLNSYQNGYSYLEGSAESKTPRVWSFDLPSCSTTKLTPEQWITATTPSKETSILYDTLTSLSDSAEILLSIYLPPSYGMSNRSYPVVYVNDGDAIFDIFSCYCKGWNLNSLMDSLADAGHEVPIIVGVHNPLRRWRLTPWADGGGTEHDNGGGVAHGEFIVKSVKPHIDSSFRTVPEREHTTIAGASRGGMFSLYLGFTYPEIFGTIYAFSPALYYSEELYPIIEKGSKTVQPRVISYTGNQESRRWFRRYAQKLERYFETIDYPKNLYIIGFDDGGHNGEFWHDCFRRAYLLSTSNSLEAQKGSEH